MEIVLFRENAVNVQGRLNPRMGIKGEIKSRYIVLHIRSDLRTPTKNPNSQKRCVTCWCLFIKRLLVTNVKQINQNNTLKYCCSVETCMSHLGIPTFMFSI